MARKRRTLRQIQTDKLHGIERSTFVPIVPDDNQDGLMYYEGLLNIEKHGTPWGSKSIVQIEQEIKARIHMTQHEIFKIGRLLLDAKKLLPNEFTQWVEEKFDFSMKTAQNFMNVYEQCSGFEGLVYHIKPSVLYRISSSKFPKDLREEILTSDIPPQTTKEVQEILSGKRKIDGPKAASSRRAVFIVNKWLKKFHEVNRKAEEAMEAYYEEFQDAFNEQIAAGIESENADELKRLFHDGCDIIYKFHEAGKEFMKETQWAAEAYAKNRFLHAMLNPGETVSRDKIVSLSEGAEPDDFHVIDAKP